MSSTNSNHHDCIAHISVNLLWAWACAGLSGLACSILNLVMASACAKPKGKQGYTSEYTIAAIRALYQRSGVAGKTAVYDAIKRLIKSEVLALDAELLAINPDFTARVDARGQSFMALAKQRHECAGVRPHKAFGKPEEIESEYSGKLGVLSGKPDSNARKPDNNSGKPDDFSAIPDNTSGMPDGPSGKPDSNAGQPDNNSGKPDDFSAIPDNTSRKPDSNSVNPDRNLCKPVRNSAKPENSGKPDSESVPRNRGRAGADVAHGTEATGSSVSGPITRPGVPQAQTRHNTDDEAQKTRAAGPVIPDSVAPEIDSHMRSKLYASLCLRVSRLPDSKPCAELMNELVSLAGLDITALDKAACALLAALQQNTLFRVFNLRGMLLHLIKNPHRFPIVSVQEVLARE